MEVEKEIQLEHILHENSIVAETVSFCLAKSLKYFPNGAPHTASEVR